MNIIDGKMPEVHKYGRGYRWYNTEDGVSRWSQTLELIPEPRQFSEKYILNESVNGPFILNHSTGTWPKKDEIDQPIVYGDYYYLEALLRKKAL